MKLEIGKTVSIMNDYMEVVTGELSAVDSDSYDDVKLDNGEVTYWSKKKKMYVPVRDKHKNSIFFEIKTPLGLEYASEKELF
jgi:spore coat protein CotF